MHKTDHIFIIAEAGVNHNGVLDLALKLCDEAKRCGADAVKFQTWKTENIVTKSASMADYQKNNLKTEKDSQYEMLKKLELSYNDFITIQKHCKQIGILFLSTPDEEESLNFLISLNMDIIKVGSGEVTNIPYLRKIGAKRKNVILSTGMSTLGDVDRACQTLKEAGTKNISLLHCTTNYPCPVREVNLRTMITLRDAFQCEVGYSDHTEGIEVPVAAVALGAKIIEKHFTLDKNMEGPDHSASLNPAEFSLMVQSIRNIEMALGNGKKEPNPSEKAIAKVVQKKIVAKRAISKDEFLSEENITVKRTAEGISACSWDLVIGVRANRNYAVDEAIYL
jgi:N-acetylneuraminate synthase/N,N'-diacetyllegionaminate synthase